MTGEYCTWSLLMDGAEPDPHAVALADLVALVVRSAPLLDAVAWINVLGSLDRDPLLMPRGITREEAAVRRALFEITPFAKWKIRAAARAVGQSQ